MDFLNNLSYDNLVDIFICIISLIGGYLINKFLSAKPIKRDILQKQLDLVYAPMFQKMENNLYKRIDEKTALEYISFFKSIKANHYSLIDSKTLFEFDKFEKILSFINYSSFCYNIDKTFERLRKKLNLPTRSFFYKLSKEQFPKNIQLRIKRFFIFVGILIALIFAGIFVFSIIYIMSSFISFLIMKLAN